MNLSASVVFIYFTHRRNKPYQTSHLDSLHENMKSGFGFPSLFPTFAPSFDQELLGGPIYIYISCYHESKGRVEKPKPIPIFFLFLLLEPGAREMGKKKKKKSTEAQKNAGV